MKKLILISIFLLAAVCASAELISKQFLFDGQYLPGTDASKIGAENYTTLQNLKYTDDGLRIVPGYTKANTNPLVSYPYVRNGYQLRSDRTTPSVVIIQAKDATGNTAVYQNQATIPNKRDFESTPLHTDSSGAGLGRFAEAPIGMAYANGVESMSWWGPEGPVGAFCVVSDVIWNSSTISLSATANPDEIADVNADFLARGFRIGQTITLTGSDTAANDDDYVITDIAANGQTIYIANGSLTADDAVGNEMTIEAASGVDYLNPVFYTEAVNNELNSAGNTAVLGGGIDSYTKLMLHFNGVDGSTTITDSSTSPHSPSASGDAQLDTAQSVFGTASGLFDGTADYVSVPDHADWNYGSSEIAIDTWIRFASTDGLQVIYEQSDSTDGDKAALYFYNDYLYLYVTEARSVLISEAAAWSPSINTDYHLAVIRGWGGGANDYAITVNGSTIHTFTNASSWSNYPGVVTIGGSLNSNFLDIGATRHHLEPNPGGAVVVTTATVKYGDGSADFNGTTGHIQIPDHANFDIFADTVTSWTIDFWVKHTDHVGNENYINQYVGANDYWTFLHAHGTGLIFRNIDGGVTENDLTGGEIDDTDWHHVAFVKDGQAMGTYLDGIQKAYDAGGGVDTLAADLYIGSRAGATNFFDGQLDDIRIYQGNPFGATGANAPNAGLTSTITPPTVAHTADSDTKLLIKGDTKSFNGWLDEFRISSGTPRWTAAFNAPIRAYQETQRRFYLLSTRPLQGFKAYLSSANTETSTLTGYEWTGKSFSELTLTDGTSSSGISMAQDGIVSFSTTENTCKPWHFEGLYLYAYMFELSAGGAELYYVTVDAPFQDIVDVWDGVERLPIEFQMWDDSDGNWDDWTLSVNQESSNLYPIGAELDDGADAMQAADYLFVGFDERVTAIRYEIIGERANTAAAQPTVYYWSGTAWVTVGDVVDTTATRKTDFITLQQTGILSWNPPAEEDEAKQTLFGRNGYYYKIQHDAALAGSGSSPDLVIDLVTGIPAQYTVPPFVFPAKFENRLFLFGYKEGKEGSRADFCLPSAPDVWNGELSSMNGLQSLYFPGSGDVVAATELYNRYGSGVITMLLVLKPTKTFALTGSDPEDFKIYPVSENIGCVAPLTLATAEMGYQIAQGIKRNIALWLSHAGLVIFDGTTPTIIKGVENYFDPTKSECVNYAAIDRARGAYSPRYSTYYLGLPTAGSTEINTILAYDLTRNKWYEIDPGTYWQAIWPMFDTDGNRYLYGGIDTGYMLRLNNGTSWAGTGIQAIVETGDFLPFNIWNQGRMRRVKVLATRIDEDVDLNVYHYADTADDDSTVDMTLDLNSGSNRLTWNTTDFSAESYLFHRFKFSTTTSSTDDLTLLGWGYQCLPGHADW